MIRGVIFCFGRRGSGVNVLGGRVVWVKVERCVKEVFLFVNCSYCG